MQRLSFARRRLGHLNYFGDEGHKSNADDRQQLIQEFLFHLVGSVEFVAQEVNRSRGLNIPVNEVSPSKVCEECERLGSDKPITNLLRELHPRVGNKPLPQDPYSREGMHFRIILMRNYVCHVGMNPFLFRVGSTPTVSLLLDNRNPGHGHSDRHALRELDEFHRLVETKCKRALELLAKPAP